MILSGFSGSSNGEESVCNAGDPNLIPGLGRSPGKGIGYPLQCSWASLVAQMVKNSPAMQETWVWSLGWEDSLEEGMATHSSILAWRIPWTEESGRLQPMGLQRVGHDWANKHSTAHDTIKEKGMAIHSSILAWRIPWPEEPGGLQPRGSQRVGHNWETNTAHIHTHTILSVKNLWSWLFMVKNKWLFGIQWIPQFSERLLHSLISLGNTLERRLNSGFVFLSTLPVRICQTCLFSIQAHLECSLPK